MASRSDATNSTGMDLSSVSKETGKFEALQGRVRPWRPGPSERRRSRYATVDISRSTSQRDDCGNHC